MNGFDLHERSHSRVSPKLKPPHFHAVSRFSLETWATLQRLVVPSCSEVVVP